jgi:DNA-binding MarR family transcriptional regulator
MNGQKRLSGDRAIAFLLAQLGAHAAAKFAERLAPLSLKPSDAGILHRLGQSSGMSQQELASTLRIHASALVSVLDDLETRGVVERKDSATDRRTYALHLTDKGQALLTEIRRLSREHNDALCTPLSNTEREMLASLLSRIADHQGLTPGVHPGYRRLGQQPSRKSPRKSSHP